MYKKYVCIGGKVVSRKDGDIHYIYSRRLAELYRVDPMDCYFVEEKDEYTWWRSMGFNSDGGYEERPIELRPRYDGNYNLDNIDN